MANYFKSKDRKVIPNFRSFDETLELGELSNAGKSDLDPVDISIEKNLIEWKYGKSIAAAGDLLSSAIVAGKTEVEEVAKAAAFVLKSQEPIPLLRDLAHRIMNPRQTASIEIAPERLQDLTTVYLDVASRNTISKRIRIFKDASRRFPQDPMVYVELARLYSILGEEKQAKKNMLIAIGLSPNNRYVLRSFVRLFDHYNEPDIAHHSLMNNTATPRDPWLLSAQIALSPLHGGMTKLMRKGKELISSGQFSPFSLAELATAMGTVELLDGSNRKSRELFKLALTDPNDNALAQTEWAVSKEHLFDFDAAEFNVRKNHEALALEAFRNKKWQETIEHSKHWLMDMPFARRPAIIASHVASAILGNQELARAFLETSLRANPKEPSLINNLAYSLALDNRTDEASSMIRSISLSEVDELTTKICLMATKGLISFRKGLYDEGRKSYLEAMENSQNIPSAEFRSLAFLNYVREEILANKLDVRELMNRVSKLAIDVVNPELEGLRKLHADVIALYNKQKEAANISGS